MQVNLLTSLVQSHTIAPYWSEQHQVMTRERVSWTAIGRELGREPVDCYRKWKSLSIVEVSQLVSGGNVGEYNGNRSEGEQSSSKESDRSSVHDTPSTAVPKRVSKAPPSATKNLKWSPDEVRVRTFLVLTHCMKISPYLNNRTIACERV